LRALCILFPGKRLAFEHMLAQIPEGFLLSFIPEHCQNIMQFLTCFLIHQALFPAFFQIFQC